MSDHLIHLTDDNFQETIRKGVTLVDFHASWCGPCRMLAPIIEEMAGMLQGKAQIGKLDIDAAQDTAASLQISAVPTIILFKDGNEVKRIVGVKSLDDLVNLVQSHL